MSGWLEGAVIALLLAVGAALAWWLLAASEGVYLGRRVVIALYDLFAHRYDAVKAYPREDEQYFLARPLMTAVAPRTDPLVLDVATGSGRLPLALLRCPDFAGYIIATDFSRGMLRQAARNLSYYEDRVTVRLAPAERLPFPDDSFDIVTCLEALEFMSDPHAVLAEMARVLRPGGILLTSQRINTPWLPGKTWDDQAVFANLKAAGLEQVRIQIWQTDYRKVWARKPSESAFIGPLGRLAFTQPSATIRPHAPSS